MKAILLSIFLSSYFSCMSQIDFNINKEKDKSLFFIGETSYGFILGETNDFKNNIFFKENGLGLRYNLSNKWSISGRATILKLGYNNDGLYVERSFFALSVFINRDFYILPRTTAFLGIGAEYLNNSNLKIEDIEAQSRIEEKGVGTNLMVSGRFGIRYELLDNFYVILSILESYGINTSYSKNLFEIKRKTSFGFGINFGIR